MRKTALVLLASFGAVCIVSAAVADDALLGKDLKTPPTGQPFCTDRDELKEFMIAGLKGDTEWAGQLQSCAMIAGGKKIAVLEDYPSDTELGHVVKVRAFGTSGSLVGYTISLGLVPRK